MPLPPELHVGTASWSSEDWITAGFYPRGMAPAEFLSHYAKSFETVEVDSTYYRAPTPYLCKKWVRDTPASFRFALKVTKTITHEKALDGCEKEFEEYLGAAEELGERLGFVVFQFGYFNKKSGIPDAATFLKRLGAFHKHCPPRHRYVVEIRNPKWISGEYLDFLREHNFIHALTDQEWMPRPQRLWDEFGERLLTSDTTYVRLLGQRERIEAITTKWDKIVIDRTPETLEWIALFRLIVGKKVPTWVFFNNHYAGYGPGSIELFRQLWEKSGAT